MGPIISKISLLNIQVMEDLKYLPDELLLLILSWVPDRSLVRQCRLVCRKWRDLIDKPTLWRLKCERDPLNKAVVEAAQGASQTDWRRICILQPFGRNLIKNPCGKSKPSRRKRKMGPIISKIALLNIQVMEDLKYLPDELLLLILSWVPDRSLVRQCRLVCRKWRDLIDKPTLWRLKCERDPLNKAVVEAAQGVSQTDWRRICILRPFGRNLIKNPCGKKKFQHWEIENGGDGWKVEKNRDHVEVEGAEAQTCFVSSYGWCIKSQVVDLLEEGLGEEMMDTFQPDIGIADWWGARDDCGCIYKIEVDLLAADQTSVISSFKAEPERIPQWNDQQYQQVSHIFRKYGPGVRYIRFLHAGKDAQFWAGHYGARITNSTAIVKFSSEPLGASTPSH